MQLEELRNDLHWYVIHTHPKQEDRADDNLRVAGVETFAPKLREYRYKPYIGELAQFVQHLFPRYIFARFKATDALHKVRFTRGVHEVVSIGHKPTPIDEEIIALVRSHIGKDGFVKVGEALKVGDAVRVKDGAFKSLKGVLEREMKGSDRVVILLNTLAYQGHFVIEKDLLEKVATGH